MPLLRRLLIIIAPCALMSVVLIFFAVYSGLHAKAERDIVRQVELSLINVGTQHRTAVGTSIRIARTIAANDSLREKLALPANTESHLAELGTILGHYAELQPAVQTWLLVDTNHQVLSYHGSQERVIATQNNTLFSTTTSFGTTLSRLDSGADSILQISHPIVTTHSEGGSAALTLGHIIIQKNLTRLTHLENQNQLVAKGFLTLVSDDGRILVHPDRSLQGTVDHSLAALLQTSGEKKNKLSIHVDENEAITGYYALPGNVYLIAQLPESNIFNSISAMAYRLAAAALIGTAMGVAAFLVLIRTFVMIPLNQLRHCAMSIGIESDQIGMTAAIDRKDEIGDLSRAFDATSKRLAASTANIQKQHAEIERLAFRDELTGLPNRRMFRNIAEQRIKSAAEHNCQLAILFLDLDDFKDINDLQGHDAGDQLLQEISARLRSCLNFNDSHAFDQSGNVAARLGGDEFIVLAEIGPGFDTTTDIANRILKTVSQPFRIDQHLQQISTSIGIARFPEDANDIERLITCADTAMYEAKRQSKNGFAVYQVAIHTALESRLQLEADLRHALEKQEFILHYQPKYCARTSRLLGAEALIRWSHPKKGFIPPDVFIPVAEQAGLIDSIGRWVLDEACRQWRIWNTAGLLLAHIAVNVSARQFANSSMLDVVSDTIREREVPPHALEIEITETSLMEAYDEVREELAGLQNMGVSIAMDDFGTGYSSLGIIAHMPIDILKLDRSFITGLQPDSPNEKIVAAILMMARHLGMKVVAEGVETASEYEFLQSLDCDIVQGYFLSKPLNATDMTQLLQMSNANGYRDAA